MAVVTNTCRYCEQSDCVCRIQLNDDTTYAERVINRIPNNFGVAASIRVEKLKKLMGVLDNHIQELKNKVRKS